MFSSAFSWRGMNTENSLIRGSNLERHNFPFWSVPTLMTPSNPGWSRTSNHFVQLYPEEKKIGTMPTASYPLNIRNKLTIIEPVNIVIKTMQKKLYKSYYVPHFWAMSFSYDFGKKNKKIKKILVIKRYYKNRNNANHNRKDNLMTHMT